MRILLVVVFLTITSAMNFATAQVVRLSSSNKGYVPSKGVVPDSTTATRLAEAVLRPIYGKNIDSKLPLRAELYKGWLWIVTGSLPDSVIGGVPYVEIQKADAKVIRIYHSK